MSRALVAWLLRAALIANRRTRPVAGFVLPTTVLLILVVSLTAGALSYRAFNTSTRTINETQNRVIYNAATPAIDRARAKVEFLFDSTKDSRFPGGVPSSDFLASMLLNDGTTPINGQKAGQLLLGGNDPYTLPDEKTWGAANGFASGRLDSNGDGTPDNAWGFRADTDGDGTQDATIVYSIALTIPVNTGTGTNVTQGWQRLVKLSDSDKAKGIAETDPRSPVPYARTGPLSNSPSAAGCGGASSGGSSVESGWYQDTTNTATLRRNFQVDAFVLPDSATKGGSTNFATLEFQQDRVLNRGNKWGAWFRNDLEIFPGPPFQWNGAMHTEGNLIIGNNSFSAYLISAPNSCLWYESSSEITVTDVSPTANNGQDFQGQVVSGLVGANSYGGSSLVYIWSQPFNAGSSKQTLDSSSDSVNASTPFDLSIDPLKIQTDNSYSSRANTNNRAIRRAAYDTSTLKKRIFNRTETAPYVDDTYRADDRYGPKQKYSDQVKIPSGKKIGDLIAGTDDVSTSSAIPITADPALTAQDDPNAKPGDTPNLGLDGYWERRARFQGLRILVGQRLELGNPFGWVTPQDRPAGVTTDAAEQTYLQTAAPAPTLPAGTNAAYTIGDNDYRQLRSSTYASSTDPNTIDPDKSDNEGDPLYPPHSASINHESRQRRALRDNLSAVQSTAVYHFDADKDYPVACMASVVHPGSPLTLQQSLNFVPTVFVDSTAAANPANNPAPSTIDTALLTDFFNGRGTDGWEFDSPGGDKATFLTDIANANSPLRIALQNLAQFAGDHISDTQTGAFPPTQESGQIHPDPEFSMWGNFSNLRRTLARLNAVGYDQLSIADKTYLHTASCTLGMLAYNVDRVQRFDPTNFKNDVVRPGQGSPILTTLVGDLYKLMDGSVNESANNFEVLPKGRLATYNYDPNGTFTAANYDARDYDRVPAEAYLGKLREYIAAQNPSINPNNDPRYRLAELIFTYFQIRRDRTFGFRPSPAANTWNYNPYVAQIQGKLNLWSSACDPNVFAINDAIGKKTGKDGVIALAQPVNSTPGVPTFFEADPTVSISRLALSRLCGTVIPPGAVRDYPGDVGFPARNGTEAGNATGNFVTPNSPGTLSTLSYIPKVDGSSDATSIFSQDTPRKSTLSVSATSAFAFKSSGAQTKLNDSAFPYTATPGGTILNDNGYPYLAASVAPKWPSLYYLFPEVEHGHKGAVEDVGGLSSGPLGTLTPDGVGLSNSKDNSNTAAKNWEDDVDHRQPTGQLTYPLFDSTFTGTPPAPTATTLLPAALQPWAEPYITDPYINTANASVTYKPVDTLTPPIIARGQDMGYVVDMDPLTTPIDPIKFKDLKSTNTLAYQYKTFGNPLADLSVARLALKPRKLPSTGFNNPFSIVNNNTWQLPITTLPANPPVQNTPPNRITAPNGTAVTGTTAVIPFLDRALFNGREWLPVRVTDIDLGMLRRTKVSSTATLLGGASKEVWLPISGIVYAFREDAVREDAINRPASGTYTDVRSPSAPVDPAVIAGTEVSLKQVDGVPDPDRRPYGFRLRNGSQLKRHSDTGVAAQDNIRGLSFFTDNPLYIMGNFNLHQSGGEDDNTAPRLEEFKEQLPNGNYSEPDFYGRVTREPNFADRDGDRWRPSELLADAISIISDTFCDGSALDTFMTAGTSGATLTTGTYEGRTLTDSGFAFPAGYFPYRASTGNTGGASVYTTTAANTSALYGRGCTNGGITSFLNQNRPSVDLPGGSSGNWGWLRENPYDIFTPIKVSRNGEGLALQVQTAARTPNTLILPATTAGSSPLSGKPLMPISYASAPLNGAYYNIASTNRTIPAAENTRVNTIVVSGLIPSRNGQSYGGLHNFPRFLEDWDRLWFAGSFLQLNFSNYATGPFDQQVWEPGTTPTAGNERISYYSPPARLWGYDVALQKSPAGPAAARFVTATKDRNEFYQEPAANDPYIRNLCIALPNTLFPDAKCPS